jgi:hypothetical protein
MPGGTLTPDSQFFQWDASALAKKQADLAENAQQGVVNQTTYQSALKRLKEQQPLDESNQQSASNRQGLFYSTNLGNKLGDIAKSYVQQRPGAAPRSISRSAPGRRHEPRSRPGTASTRQRSTRRQRTGRSAATRPRRTLGRSSLSSHPRRRRSSVTSQIRRRPWATRPVS